ncbi:type VI secretion system-associated protein TagF [Methylocella silvestris]|uniref:Type VI secretion system-associated protein TagF n=1 Tax=Methylocella silvestris TaxID=199596 RepID=A0A2J7TG56_METSI|nr:type VI secretion system-associated protein TagF [Methylocella silvestris]PNG25738.1 type VI secretion system-associated protein TagF [Methylocella silvestris]
MRCGLIGKIAAKPDYVALDAPAPLLAAMEPWLHASIASSRLMLGESWQGVFRAAPIWRFWLGAEISGAPVLGALAPSIDAGGRYFPLIAFAASEPPMAILPPEFADHDAWFQAAEALLLATLAQGASYEAAVAAVERLPAPACAPAVAIRPPLAALAGGVTAPLDDKPLAEVFSWLRRADWGKSYGARSFWWTAGGVNFRPRALGFYHLPDPSLFAAMLTGEFSGGPGAGMG